MNKFLLYLPGRIALKKQTPKLLSFILFLLFAGISAFAQKELRNPEVSIGHLVKVVPSLKDIKIPANYHPKVTRIGDRIIGINEDNEEDERIQYSKTTKPDPVVQRFVAKNPVGSNTNQAAPPPGPDVPTMINQNFDGMGYTSVSPADPTMCAGPNHIIQMINGSSGAYLKVWNRSGVQVVAQTYMDLLVGGAGYTGSGDPIALYDQFSDRYMLTEFGNVGGGSINSLVVLVSMTNDPSGGWYVYRFTDNSFFPDYPHWGIFPNVLYATTNDFAPSYVGSSVWAMNKVKMIAGNATAEVQRFRLGFQSAPVNISGSTPPAAGSPGMFMYYSDDDFTANPNDVDSIGIITMQPDFAVPANTTLTFAQAMVTAPFKSGVCGGRNCVPSAANNGYDAISDRVMNRIYYRKFATYESMVLNYTVDANAGIGNPKSGLRWYELRRTSGNWSIFQQSTYAPDADWRWMGSININSKGQIALGFNLSGPSKYASIYFTGRNIGDAPNTMSIQEVLAKAGTAYGTFGNRWGDYNDLATDVVNDSLFWMTAMYGNTAAAWATRITQFQLGDCDVLSSSIATAAPTSVPELQNIVYNHTVNNTGCAPMSNFLLTDTLPTNVTFVSATNGGTYNAGNRVVSWPVNINAGLTQNYGLTVNINAGSYFAPVTLLSEPIAGAGIPAGWAATTGTGPASWVVSNAQSHSAPNSFFGVDFATAGTDFRISTTNPLALGNPTSKLTFWHNFDTEAGWDGGVVEISTNGGTTWNDLGSQMTINGYNNSVGTGSNNPIAPRPAFSGNSNGWIQTTVNLLPYANQNALFRFRMSSDDNTAAVGWYVDDILITSVAQVNMRTSLFNSSNARVSYKDTFTLITPAVVACSPTITQQPTAVSTCAGANASFTCVATASAGVTYQWQESTTGAGGPWNNITNGGVYSGATSSTLNLTGVTIGMNNYQYRCEATGTCAPNALSSAAVLAVAATSIGGTVNPPNTPVCGTTNSGTLTLSGHTGAVIRWESATILAGPYTPIANTTTTLTFNNLTQTTYFRAIVQVPGCVPVPSTVATVTFSAAGSLVIIADPSSTLCQGDPALLTVRLGSASPIGTLYNQAGVAGNGSPSQVFEPANAAFTSQSADDFTVPAGTTWTVTRVTADGIGAGIPTSVNVFFYNNSAGNLPGTLVASYPNLLTFVQTGANYNVTLPTGLLLAPGTYWVSVQVNMSFATGGQWFWGNFGTTNIGSEYAWQNPGAGFGTPCTSWGYGATGCAVGGGVNRNNIFSIVGSSLADGGPLPPGYTYLWSPAAGLSSTTTNPVAASPMTTTTYTVNVNDGAGCIRQASILMTVNLRPTITSNPANSTNCVGTTATFTVAATGTNLVYQWQVSTDGGLNYSNLTNVAPYSNVTTATLTINPVTIAMNNYRYRCVLTGVCAPIGTANISTGAILTVNPLPVVAVTPTSGCGGVAGSFGTLLTASGANSYTWSPLAGLFTDPACTVAYTGTNTATVYAAPTVYTAYTVTGTLSATGCSNTATALLQYTPPAPTVTPSAVAMCLGDVAVRLVSSSSTSTTLNFASGPISVIAPDANPAGATSNITVSGIPAACNVSAIAVTWNMNHTWDGDMVFALKAPNGAILNLDYYLTNTGGTGATTGFVNTTVSSTGTAALSSGSGTYTGTFKADALNAGIGGTGGPTGYTPTVTTWAPLYANPNGVWTLAMKDGFGGDQGTLTSWSINMTYVCGVPSTPAVWTPNGVGSGLFTDPAALIAYTGTPTDTVYARPTPSGVYPYQATVQSLGGPASDITTTFANNNQFGMVIFNFKNNNAYPVNITGIESIAATSGASVATLYYKTTPIAGPPGAISLANGWLTAGTANYTAIANLTTTTPQPFLSGLSLTIPAGATYGIGVESKTAANVGNLRYSTVAAGVYTISANGCDLITGTNIGYAGDISPATLLNTPRGFIGIVRFGSNSTVCTSPARTVVVTVNQPTTVTTQPVNKTICTDKVATFTVAAAGTGPFSYQWQVSTNSGNTWTNIANGGVYAGATTTTLTITAPPVSMNGYYYRCVITGAAPCVAANSFQAVLTVNPLPTIVISASPYTSLFPGLVTTLSSTVTPNAAAQYTWLRNGSPVAGATTGTLGVNVDGLGDYTLRVTDVNGCTNTSNQVTIKDSASGKCFIYPNPNGGQFQVRYYSTANAVLPRSLTVFDAKGSRVMTQYYTIGRPYDRMDVDLRKYGKGLYWVEIGDMNGNRLTMCRIVIE